MNAFGMILLSVLASSPVMARELAGTCAVTTDDGNLASRTTTQNLQLLDPKNTFMEDFFHERVGNFALEVTQHSLGPVRDAKLFKAILKGKSGTAFISLISPGSLVQGEKWQFAAGEHGNNALQSVLCDIQLMN